MNEYVVVPDMLTKALHKHLDEAYAKMPIEQQEEAKSQRAEHYRFLMSYFDQYGTIPSFTIEKKIP